MTSSEPEMVTVVLPKADAENLAELLKSYAAGKSFWRFVVVLGGTVLVTTTILSNFENFITHFFQRAP